MKAKELLAAVEALGVVVTLDRDDLLLQPGSRLSPKLVQELRDHKAELLAVLKGTARPAVKDSLPGGVTESRCSLEAADVLAMPLEEFARAGLAVEVCSEVLGEVVLLASDNALLDPSERRPVYRAAELRELLGLSPSDLRQVHRVKVIFGGTVEAS